MNSTPNDMDELDGPRYSPPVDQLLTLGEADLRKPTWSDYRQLGLSAADVPDLIRMMTDMDLHRADLNSTEIWAPIHAWRALGQLRAEAAVEPLLNLLIEFEDEDFDWLTSETPRVMSLIGPAAIPALATYLRNPINGFSRATASESLEQMANDHPTTRDMVVSILTDALNHFDENDPDLNGFIIASLIELNAVEAAPVMERAFEAMAVDPMIAGDWHDVQVDLGLKSADAPREWEKSMAEYMESKGIVPWFMRGYDQEDDEMRLGPSLVSRFKSEKKASAKKKAKRKQAAKSRKQNRKRK